MKKIKDSENIVVLGLFLSLISAIAAASLALVNEYTKEPRRQVRLQAAAGALNKILPPFDNDVMKNTVEIASTLNPKNKIVFYGAKENGKLTSLAVKNSAAGYKGKVEIMLSFSPGGKIRTVVVGKHGETPGIGTKVTDRKSKKLMKDLIKAAGSQKGGSGKLNKYGLAKNDFLDQFSGLDIKIDSPRWQVKKDGGRIVEVTGATISSRAVTDAAYDAMATFVKNREKILAALR